MTKAFFSAHTTKTLILIFLLVSAQYYCQAQSTPLPNGFAHNDYKHKRPLQEALDNGFTNIEADIFLRDTTLVVAHVCPVFRMRKTLEKLYLKPLYERIQQNNKQGRLALRSKPTLFPILRHLLQPLSRRVWSSPRLSRIGCSQISGYSRRYFPQE